MAIPIKRYIDIGTTLINASSGNRDFSGLVFTSSEISTSAPSAIKTAYDAGKVVSLGKSEVSSYFASTTSVYKFAAKYFGYSSINGRSPAVLNIVKTGSETPLVKFNSVLEEFNNFGSFSFLDVSTLGEAESGGLLDIAMANQGFGFNYVMAIGVSADNAEEFSGALHGIKGCHIVLDSSTSSYCEWMPMAFIASINYSVRNSASTMMYKVFGGADVTVSTNTDANKYDNLRINYVGIVQSRGKVRKFYQTGVNMDGMDLGVYVDSCWITSEIENGWIDLATGSNRIPANAQGATAVSTMITSVAERAIDNGCILLDKPLTENQKQSIREMIGDGGITAIQSVGYFVTSQIVFEENRYICRYILVYAKGDTIQKVVGQHYLA